MTAAATVVVADDHPAMLAAMAEVLARSGFDVVGRAADGQQAVALIEATKPTVAVVDVRMPKVSGIEVAIQSAAVSPETSIVFYTAFGDRALLSEALDVGARGFVLKEAPLSDLVRCVELVVAGEAYVDPGARRVPRQRRGHGPDPLAHAARARGAAPARRRARERGDRQAAAHLAGDRAHPRPQGDDEARGGYAHAGRRDGAAAVHHLLMELRTADLDADPLAQFRQWFDEAAGVVRMREAMAVATATTDGAPSVRMVLLKAADERGLVFFTHYTSRKGRELEANPQAALLFHWDPLGRQVRVEGAVERVSAEESDAYFATRPEGARIGANASRQSEVLATGPSSSGAWPSSRESGAARPEWWGGFRLVPDAWEFWQHRDDRLHDRFRYLRRDGAWVSERLYP